MKSNDPQKPLGAHCLFNGQLYKIGRFNRVFVHRNGEWVFTNGVTMERLVKEIQRQAINEDADRTIKGYVL